MVPTRLQFAASVPLLLALANCTTAPVKTYHALLDNGDKPSVEIQLDMQGEDVTAVRMDVIGRDSDGTMRHFACRISKLTQEHDPSTLHFQVNFDGTGAAPETYTLTTSKSFADTRDGTLWTLKSSDGEPVDFTPAGVKQRPAMPAPNAAARAALARLESQGFAPAEDAGWACLTYDGENKVVYSATRRLAEPNPHATWNQIDADLVESIASPRPDCWQALLKAFPQLAAVDDDAAWLAWHAKQRGEPPGKMPPVFVALHDRKLGNEHFLLVLEFTKTSQMWLAYLITPATTSSGPTVRKIAVGPDPDGPKWSPDQPKTFFDTPWASRVIHAAVMDPVDESHFSVETLYDSHIVFYEFYLTARPADGYPGLLIKGRP